MLRRRDEGKGKIDFVDIAAPDYSPEQNAGLSFEQVRPWECFDASRAWHCASQEAHLSTLRPAGYGRDPCHPAGRPSDHQHRGLQARLSDLSFLLPNRTAAGVGRGLSFGRGEPPAGDCTRRSAWAGCMRPPRFSRSAPPQTGASHVLGAQGEEEASQGADRATRHRLYGIWAKWRLPITGRPDLATVLAEKKTCGK